MEKYTFLSRQIGPIVISYSHKKNALFGRFGGGWNWAFGVKIGFRTILFQLIFFELSINWSGFIKE